MPVGGVTYDRSIDTSESLDLLRITQEDYPWKGELTVLTERHKFPVMNQWFQKHRVIQKSGDSIAEIVIIDENGSAQFVEPYEEQTLDVPDVTAKIMLPWRRLRAHYSFEDTEIAMNRDPSRLMDLLDARRAPAELSMANKLEDRAWEAPTSTSDKKNPHGIPYWFVPITSAQVAAATRGHQGANASGFSDVAGIDASATANALWRSYNDVWTNGDKEMTEDDVQKVVRMLRHLQFDVPVIATDWTEGKYANFTLNTTEDMLDNIEIKARENNDSLGADLSKYSGRVMFKGTVVQWNEDLDDETTNPLVAINHDYFCPVVMEGNYFREIKAMNDRKQPQVFTSYIFLMFNFILKNRRMGGGRIDWVT